MRGRLTALLLLFAILSTPTLASAHAFGQQYTLPLPFQFYALGASAALLASFIFLTLSPQAGTMTRKTFAIPSWGMISLLLCAIGIFGFIATIFFAFFGIQDFNLNLVPELFWTIFLLGFTYLNVFIGGLWRYVSPFEAIARILFVRNKPLITYQRKFGYSVAFIMYYGLIWFELLSYGAGSIPSIIGSALLGYLAISIVGAGLFGAEDWFTYADFFTVFFGLVGYFAPIQIERGEVSLQLPADRLITEKAGHVSLIFFVLLMLSSTAFDGLEETQIWWTTLYHSAYQMQIYTLERAVIFLASPFIFLALYALAVWLMRLLTKTEQGLSYLLARFAFSVIPIAIAYNFAHYFTLLINGSQLLFVLISDPLGKGWNIFGTAQYQINVGLVGTREIWYTQFSAIVFGHIISTYVAHRIASREFSSGRQVFFGQLPMLILMVFYTVFGLWILSQGYQTVA